MLGQRREAEIRVRLSEPLRLIRMIPNDTQ
jgi:hypothetical protein